MTETANFFPRGDIGVHVCTLGNCPSSHQMTPKANKAPEHRAAQFEFAGTADVFNLASETGIDGARVQAEREATEAAKQAAILAEQTHPTLF